MGYIPVVFMTWSSFDKMVDSPHYLYLLDICLFLLIESSEEVPTG